jgi:hypothetical protein
MAARIGFFALKLGMDSRQRSMKSLRHFRESGKSHRLAQAPANPVALDSAADLPRHGETDAHGAIISSRTRL